MRLIAQAQAQKIMNPIDPRIAVHIGSGAIIATAQASIDGGYSLDDAAIAHLVEACWKSLARG
jgi:hypothetical protein